MSHAEDGPLSDSDAAVRLERVLTLIKFHLKPTLLAPDVLERRARIILDNVERGPQYRGSVIIDLARIYVEGSERNADTDAAALIERVAGDIYAAIVA